MAGSFCDSAVEDRSQCSILVGRRARGAIVRRKRAAAAMRDDVTVLIELAVCTRDRVRIDREPLREVVDRWKLLVAREHARRKRRRYRLVDLAVHRNAAVVVDAYVEGHLYRHITS